MPLAQIRLHRLRPMLYYTIYINQLHLKSIEGIKGLDQ